MTVENREKLIELAGNLPKSPSSHEHLEISMKVKDIAEGENVVFFLLRELYITNRERDNARDEAERWQPIIDWANADRMNAFMLNGLGSRGYVSEYVLKFLKTCAANWEIELRSALRLQDEETFKWRKERRRLRR